MLKFLFNGTNLRPFYEADNGGAGGSGNPEGGTGNTPSGSGNSDNNQPFAVFPDADSFNSRVSREAKKLMKEQLKEIGYEKFDDLKTSLEGFKNLQTELDTTKTTFTNSEKQYKDSIAKANEKLIGYEVKLQAKDLGIIDVDAAYTLMDKSGVSIAEDGSIIGVKEALDNLVSTRQYLIGSKGTSKGGQDFSGGNNDTPVLTMEVIKNMSQSEMNSRLAEVTEFLKKNG